ncbi:MAG TPA: enoyl-CoA hydratase/isomerase family protein [Cycloclasticus sp.]|jgi:enoyl-CoA hydratase/carnithine racemase|nr:enoyl-CoA hydratase/isomerase family protein [Cycloclasticus sp.]HIL92820.1 enoyl-CoA hydratase/isomerase family protein [Cycloclasticus sp.]
MPNTDELIYEVNNGVATICLNRPERKNALSTSLVGKLRDAWEWVDTDDAVKVVVLTSTDCGVFCAGMDLKEAAEIKQQTGEDVLSTLKDPFHQRMRDVKKPIIAAMTGHLMAGGMLLSLNSDLRVGLVNTRVGITEAKIGRGSPWAVPLIGMLPQPLIMELVLTAAQMPIQRFYDVGFINYLEETPELVRERAYSLANTIRDNAPLSVVAAKASIMCAMSLGCDDGLAEAKRLHEVVYASEDGIEGPLSFAEKRKPQWKGR